MRTPFAYIRRLLGRGAQITEVAAQNRKPDKKTRLHLARKRRQQKNSRRTNQ